MAPTLRGVSTASGAGSSASIANPAAYQAGDALFAIIQHNNASLSGRPPGTTIQAGSVFGSGTLRCITWDTPDVGPWDFTFSASVAWNIVLVAVVPDTPTDTVSIDVLQMAQAASSNSTAVIPAVTTTVASDLLVWGVGWARGTTWTGPGGGLTERADIRSGDTSSDHSLWVGTEQAGAAGSTGSRTITNDNPFTLSAAAPNVVGLAVKSTPAPVDWVGDFETNDLSQWSGGLNYNQTPTDGINRAEIRTDGPYAGTRYLRLICDPEDVTPKTPTVNPRAQVQSPRMMRAGQIWWAAFAVRLPVDFPVLQEYPQGWCLLAQLFGSPFSGSAPSAIQVADEQFLMTNLGSNPENIRWRAPIVRGAWQHFAFRTKFSTDASVGWTEFYYNGNLQLIQERRERRFKQQTLVPGSDADAQLYLSLYHKLGAPDARISADYDAGYIGIAPPPPIADQILIDRPMRVAVRR